MVTWLLVFGIGASLLWQLPTVVFSLNALGSPVSLPLSATTLSAVFLALLAGVGAENVVRIHPRFLANGAAHGRSLVFWALPMALTSIAVVLLPEAPTSAVQVVALLISGGLLALTFFCLYATVERGRPGFRRARLTLDILAYGSALLLFLFVYQTRTRSLLSGTLVALTAALLAIEILRNSSEQSGSVVNYSLIVGLILGQVTWALNYWLLPGLTGGLILLLIFYILVGIAQQGIQGRLTRRVLIEFVVFAAIAVVLIMVVGPRSDR